MVPSLLDARARQRCEAPLPLVCQGVDGWGAVSDTGCAAQRLPDAAEVVTLERADGVAVGLGFGLVARDILDRLGVTARASDRHAVNGCVDLTVAAAIEAVAIGAS